MRWLFLLFCFSASATPQTDVEKIRQNLMRYPAVHGTYKQVRQIKDMNLSLESGGNFVFKLPLDMVLDQAKPFAMKLAINSDKIVQKNADGTEQVITKAEQPAVFAFSTSVLSVFAGDKDALEKNFSYRVTMKGEKWTLVLQPKDALFKKAIAEVRIDGGKFVESVDVQETSGNTSRLTFTGVKGG